MGLIYEIFLGYSIFSGKNVVYFCANSKPILCYDVMRCGVAKICVVQCSRVVGYFNCVKDTLFIRTSNNQRLRNVGSNDRRSKRFCSNAVLCVSFTLQMVKTRVIRLRVFDGSNARDQIARFYTFHSFLVEVQTKAGVLTIYPNHAGQNLVHKHKTEKIDVVGEKPATKSASRLIEQTKKSRKITLPKNTAHVF